MSRRRRRNRQRQASSRRQRRPVETAAWPNPTEVIQWYRTAISGADLLRHEHGVDPGVLGAAWFMAGLAILKARYSPGGRSGVLETLAEHGAQQGGARPGEPD